MTGVIKNYYSGNHTAYACTHLLERYRSFLSFRCRDIDVCLPLPLESGVHAQTVDISGNPSFYGKLQ